MNKAESTLSNDSTRPGEIQADPSRSPLASEGSDPRLIRLMDRRYRRGVEGEEGSQLGIINQVASLRRFSALLADTNAYTAKSIKAM